MRAPLASAAARRRCVRGAPRAATHEVDAAAAEWAPRVPARAALAGRGLGAARAAGRRGWRRRVRDSAPIGPGGGPAACRRPGCAASLRPGPAPQYPAELGTKGGKRASRTARARSVQATRCPGADSRALVHAVRGAGELSGRGARDPTAHRRDGSCTRAAGRRRRVQWLRRLARPAPDARVAAADAGSPSSVFLPVAPPLPLSCLSLSGGRSGMPGMPEMPKMEMPNLEMPKLEMPSWMPAIPGISPVCVHVCGSVCISVCMYLYFYGCVHAQACVCAHMHVCNTLACVYTHMHASVYRCMHLQTCIRARASVCAGPHAWYVHKYRLCACTFMWAHVH